ncbi:MAG: glycosyltransferase [Proteobacteria bacterium]|nr:glycosyltransferase [Pseudomonadota bacterium]NIS72493.1 glycosyltransferase [Pseudomonadota bacterium]
MRVIFLTRQNPQGYRIQHYFPYLEIHGVQVSLRVIPRQREERYLLFRELPGYDVVYVQRRLLGPLHLFLLRRASKRLVYDFDDAVMYRSSRHSNPRSFSRRWAFRGMVRASDAVIAGNQFLRGEALKYVGVDKISVVPTVVDPKRYPPKDHGVQGDSIVLGWIGSGSTIWYLQNLTPVLETVYRRYPQLKLKIVSDRFFDCATIPTIKKKWKCEEEVMDLQSFDIGLMPLTDDVWASGKCGLKAIQYSAVGIPVVCSPVGINRDVVEDGLNGYWANTDSDWVEKISKLIEAPQLREDMGANGRKRVEESFSLDRASETVLDLFRHLCFEA